MLAENPVKDFLPLGVFLKAVFFVIFISIALFLAAKIFFKQLCNQCCWSHVPFVFF
jgi:hypothetical protein